MTSTIVKYSRSLFIFIRDGLISRSRRS